jgi:pimeloyl-ACP methyl ester carboxylesterase
MNVTVNGARLWYDVDGQHVVPDGSTMRERPTMVLVHGGPGSYDHSYFKPDFGRLTGVAQVVYLDLRAHGRSEWGDPDEWTFEQCADDLRAFCDALGIARPVVFGHSMGGWIVLLYGARHPGHAGGLVLQGTMARFDLERLVEGFRRAGGDEVAEIARRHFGVAPVGPEEWARCYGAFGPNLLTDDQLTRRIRNPDVGLRGMRLLQELDVLDQVALIESPTLVCVGELEAGTPVSASQEIADALPAGIGRLEVVPGAGHFTWLDAPDRYWPILEDFVRQTADEANILSS